VNVCVPVMVGTGSAGLPTRPAGYTGDGLTGRLWNTTSCLTAAALDGR
jgi:hypothetical protein